MTKSKSARNIQTTQQERQNNEYDCKKNTSGKCNELFSQNLNFSISMTYQKATNRARLLNLAAPQLPNQASLINIEKMQDQVTRAATTNVQRYWLSVPFKVTISTAETICNWNELRIIFIRAWTKR